jgi:hemoglobin
MAEPTLYERLGGIFAIAAVMDHFSDQLLKNPKVVEANPELNEWHTAKYPGRLPGLKFLGRCGSLRWPVGHFSTRPGSCVTPIST